MDSCASILPEFATIDDRKSPRVLPVNMNNPEAADTPRPFPKFMIGLLAVFLVGLATLATLSQGEDETVTFSREVPSALPIETLGKSLDTVLAWPQWHHITVDARRMDAMNQPLPLNEQDVTPGAVVRFTLEPRQRPDRRFDIIGQITEHVPGRKVSVKFLRETKPQVAKLFDSMEWTIELSPGTETGAPGLPRDSSTQGTTVRGTLKAHTSSWRARLFSRIAHRILMNQVFYPNLPALAELKTPRTFDQAFPESQR